MKKEANIILAISTIVVVSIVAATLIVMKYIDTTQTQKRTFDIVIGS